MSKVDLFLPGVTSSVVVDTVAVPLVGDLVDVPSQTGATRAYRVTRRSWTYHDGLAPDCRLEGDEVT